MGVEFLHHGGDGFVLQGIGIGGVDVVVADIPHHLVEFAAAIDADALPSYTYINIVAQEEPGEEDEGGPEAMLCFHSG